MAQDPRRQRADRDDKQLVAGHFPRPVAKQLRRIAVERDTTIQALLTEAIAGLLSRDDLDGSKDLAAMLLRETGKETATAAVDDRP